MSVLLGIGRAAAVIAVLSLALAAGAALAGATGGRRQQAALLPLLTIALLAGVSLFVLLAFPATHALWLLLLVLAIFSAIAIGLRRQLLPGGTPPPVPARASVGERIAGVAVFVALGVLIVGALVQPPPELGVVLESGFAAQVIAAGRWAEFSGLDPSVSPAPPAAPAFAALAGFFSKLTAYDARWLAGLSLAGYAGALWLLWHGLDRRIEGRTLLVAACALLPGWLFDPAAGARAGSATPVLACLYAGLLLLGERLALRPTLPGLAAVATIGALVPLFGAQGWAFLVLFALFLCGTGRHDVRSRLAGPLTLAAAVLPAFALAQAGEFASAPWASLENAVHDPGWHGPYGVGGVLKGLLGPIGRGALLSWLVLIVVTFAPLSTSLHTASPGALAPWLALAYPLTCAFLPALAANADALQGRLLEIAPLTFIGIGRLLAAPARRVRDFRAQASAR